MCWVSRGLAATSKTLRTGIRGNTKRRCRAQARTKKGAVVIRRFALAFALAAASLAFASFADPAKVLRVSMDGEEAGLDPQAVGELYSLTPISAMFEPLYEYDYYGSARIVLRTAAAMPEISADGLTWRIRIKPGIRFVDDPAFQGPRARTRRGGLHVRVEAPYRSARALAQCGDHGRPPRGRRRATRSYSLPPAGRGPTVGAQPSADGRGKNSGQSRPDGPAGRQTQPER